MTAVRNATAGDRAAITALIDRSFFHLDANRWLVPESPQRSDVMRRYFRLHVEHAVEHGTAVQVALDDQDQAIVGAALWYPSGDPGPTDYDTQLAAAVGPERLHRFEQFEHLLHEHTPDQPHDYLGFLAVDPDHQGAGIGGRLLREWHWHLDAAGRPAYLVASNKRSARLYWTHGYRPLPAGRDELLLPGGGSMYRMWRAPGVGDSSTPAAAGAAGDPTVLTPESWNEIEFRDKRQVGRFVMRGSGARFAIIVDQWSPVDGDARLARARQLAPYGDSQLPVLLAGDLNCTERCCWSVVRVMEEPPSPGAVPWPLGAGSGSLPWVR